MELRRNCEGTFACLQVRYVIYRNQIFIVINNCRCRGNTIYSLSLSLALSFSFASPRFVSALSTERKSRLSGDIPSAQFGSRSSHTNSIFLNGHAGVFLGMAVLVYGRPPSCVMVRVSVHAAAAKKGAKTGGRAEKQRCYRRSNSSRRGVEYNVER